MTVEHVSTGRVIVAALVIAAWFVAATVIGVAGVLLWDLRNRKRAGR